MITDTLKRNARYFVAALSVTLILIGALYGFILVDLSTERYMPELFSPIYLINEVNSQGIGFYWLGQQYRLETARIKEVKETLLSLRGFIPRTMRIAGAAAAFVHD